jgi:hypothetical protein
MPKDLGDKFASDYNLEADVIKENLYKQPNPNTYLATFARFIVENKNHPYCKGVIEKGFQQFINNYIMQFELATKVPVSFVGSIAFYLQDELKKALERNDLILGTILQKPIDGLVKFHQNKM